jgi:tetratricopeptide (TPR) repeat protein
MEQSLETPGQPIKNGSMAHEHSVYMMLADSAAQAGDESVLRKYAPLLEELALRDQHRPYLAVAHRAWGVAHRLAGEYAEAEMRLNKALEMFEALQARWQIGRTLAELAALAQAGIDPDRARAYLTQALSYFEAIGATPDVERIRRALETVSKPGN